MRIGAIVKLAVIALLIAALLAGVIYLTQNIEVVHSLIH